MKKGFTLVELLAVIVILAIIAIITIPMIASVIEKSKLGAMEDSAYGLIEAANYYYAEHMNEMSSNKLFVIENGNQTSEEKLNYKGKIEGNAKVLLASNGKVALCLTNGKSYAKKGITDSKVVMHTVSEATTCDITTSENGDVVIDITGGSTSDTINIKLEELEQKINNVENDINNINTVLDEKVDKTTIEEALSGKVDNDTLKTLKVIYRAADVKQVDITSLGFVRNRIYLVIVANGGSANASQGGMAILSCIWGPWTLSIFSGGSTEGDAFSFSNNILTLPATYNKNYVAILEL